MSDDNCTSYFYLIEPSSDLTHDFLKQIKSEQDHAILCEK